VVYAASQPQTVYVETAPAAEVGEAVAQAPASEREPRAAPAAQAVAEGVAPSGESGLSIATERYLSLGDRAFRENRFADAVHFYARAAELAPRQGVLQLVLSDALFATGDYRYAAYALRRAFELEPELFDSPVDKRAFYGDAELFGRQLAVLETYVEDHPADLDARLVLAANLYFGARPAAAVDLLEDTLSTALRTDPLATHLLSKTRAVQYGGRAAVE